MLASGVLDAGSGLWGEDCSCGERDAVGGGGEVCEEGLWGKVTRRRKTDLAAVTMTKKDT